MALFVTRYLPTRLADTKPRHGLTCVPFIAGVGMQINSSDLVVMQRRGDGGRAPGFPITLDAFRMRLAAGDERARAANTFLWENWDGPVRFEGIQAVQDGFIMSNHGTSPVCAGVPLCII